MRASTVIHESYHKQILFTHVRQYYNSLITMATSTSLNPPSYSYYLNVCIPYRGTLGGLCTNWDLFLQTQENEAHHILAHALYKKKKSLARGATCSNTSSISITVSITHSLFRAHFSLGSNSHCPTSSINIVSYHLMTKSHIIITNHFNKSTPKSMIKHTVIQCILCHKSSHVIRI